MNIGSIISTLLGVVGGGWGSAVAALLVVGASIYFVRLYNNWKAKQLVEKTENQSATDQTGVISGNQNQSGQINKDDAANEAAKPKPGARP